MARPDPDHDPSKHLSKLQRARRIAKWLALFSMAVAAAVVVLAMRGGGGVQGHMLIATALGAALTVLLGTGVMILTFLNSPTGRYPRDEDQ